MKRLLLMFLLLGACLGPVHAAMIRLDQPRSGVYAPGVTLTVSSTATAVYDYESLVTHTLYFNGKVLVSASASDSGIHPHVLSKSVGPLSAGVHTFASSVTTNQGKTFTSSVSTVTVAYPRDADYVAQSVPTTMVVGQPYTATVKMKNVGTLTWAAADGYRLGSQNPQDNTTWGLKRVNVSGSVARNQTATFTFTVKAPRTSGTHNFRWRMLDEGQAWFGAVTPNVAVTVQPSVIKGYVDGVSGDVIRGWACSTRLDASINVHLYTGGASGTGTYLGSFRADQSSEAAVASACLANGTAYRYRIPITDSMVMKHAGKTIYVHGISPVGAGNALLTNSGKYRIPINEEPIVALTSPAQGSTKAAPAAFTLSADAAGGDDDIASVTFYANNQAVHTDSTAPYSYAWSGVTAGTYSIHALARDTRGGSTASAARSVTVKTSVVKGTIDGVFTEAGDNAYIRGWACSTLLPQSIQVHLYVGGGSGSGTLLGSYAANASSGASVAQACESTGTRYGFSIPITAEMRRLHPGRPIYVHGISPVGETNHLLARSGQFTMPGGGTSTGTATRRYVYDVHHRLCKTIEPETGATIVEYDAAGNVAWSASGQPYLSTTDCQRSSVPVAERVSRQYDSRNRVRLVTYPDNRGNLAYTYTPDGLVASVSASEPDSTVTTTYAYNRLRLLSQETLNWNNIQWGIGYGYTGNGHLASVHYPSGLAVSYAPNALGQPTRAGNFATNVSYWPNGGIKQFTYGNGVVHTLTQNARGLPVRSRDAYGSTAVLDDSYDYDFNGNVAAISDGLAGNIGDRTMRYDGLDRLVEVISPMFGGDNIAAFGYDAIDNLLYARVGNRQQVTYDYDASNRLTNVRNAGGSTVLGLGYDARGNVSNKNGKAFDFDYGNRLRSISGTASYVYDGPGRRVRDVSGGSKYSLYSQAGQLLYANDHRRALETDYVYLGGSVVAMREQPHGSTAVTVKYQHTDALGSPVAVTDSTAQVLERDRYGPYGTQIGGAANDGPGYTGHVMDAATGLTYMQQRYYDPTLGRFLSVDPVTADVNTGGNFSRYWYANNSPYRYKDPDGRLACGPGNDNCGEQLRKLRQRGIPTWQAGAPSSQANSDTSKTGKDVNWKKLGQSLEGKIGPALAAQARVKLGPLEVKAGPEVSFGYGANASGQVFFHSETELNVITVSVGRHAVGLAANSWGRDTGGYYTFGQEKIGGYKYRIGKAKSNWAVGIEIGIPGAAASVEADLKKMWEAARGE